MPDTPGSPDFSITNVLPKPTGIVTPPDRTDKSDYGNTPPTAKTTPGRGGKPDGELIVRAAGQTITGWKTVRVTRGVERMPSDFAIGMTARYPDEARKLIQPGAPTTLTIGGHVVITGYAEKFVSRLSAESHEITMVGRGRCCDLVDAAAILKPGMGLNVTSIGALARQLVQPFAGPITVLTPDGDGDGKDYYLQINLSESVYEILERVGRYEGLLQYENENGDLVLSRVGKLKHSSGFAEGVNIQFAERYDSQDERFSSYIPQLMSADFMGRDGASGNFAGNPVPDPGITRYRPKIVISEQVGAGGYGLLAEQRALWEALRRSGRSQRVTIECDSWLDSNGMPWTPNMIAPISLPTLGLQKDNWVITEVTYKRDGQKGTTADITLMPPEALTVEPEALQGLGARLMTPSPDPLGAPTPTVAPVTAPNGNTRTSGRRDLDG